MGLGLRMDGDVDQEGRDHRYRDGGNANQDNSDIRLRSRGCLAEVVLVRGGRGRPTWKSRVPSPVGSRKGGSTSRLCC